MDTREPIAVLRRDMLPFIIFGLAFCVRLLYFFEMRHHPFFHVLQLDEQVYDQWALSIAGGDWRGGDRAYFTTPLYAYILAALYKVGGHSYAIVRFIQIVTGSCTWIMIYMIGRDLFGKRPAFIAALAGCFYGYSVFSDCQILKHSLVMTTFAAALLFAMKAKGRKDSHLWLVTGLFLGLTTVSQANTLLLAPVFVASIVIGRAVTVKQFCRSAAALLAGMAFIMTPFIVRNYVVEKRFSLMITYNGGATFYIGNNPASDGGILGGELSHDKVPQNKEMDRHIEFAEKAMGRKLKASEASSYWFGRGGEFIKSNPEKAASLMLRKTALFWNWYEIPDNVDFYYLRSESTVLRFAFISFSLISPFALLGMILALRNWRCHLQMLIMIAVFMASVVAFLVTARFRIMITPLLCLYAAYGADTAVGFLHRRNWPMLSTAAAVLASALVFTNLDILHYPMEHSRQMLGNIFFQNRMYPEAYAEYKSAIRVFPLTFNRSLKFNFASAATQVGALDEALDQYRQLLMYPDLDNKTRVAIYSNISSVLTGKGDRYGAAAAAQEAAFLRRTLAK